MTLREASGLKEEFTADPRCIRMHSLTHDRIWGRNNFFFFGFLFLSINFLIKYAKLGVFAAGGSEDYYNSAN